MKPEMQERQWCSSGLKISGLAVQEKSMFYLRLQTEVDVPVQVQRSLLEKVSFLGEGQSFVLVTSSVDWRRPTHIMEGTGPPI